MAEPGGPMRLKEWLIAQIDSGRYPGLRWEDRHRTLFRIPWKHAAKQDYRQQQDAALFKAWAVYKGKYHEGMDKADPSTWKTRPVTNSSGGKDPAAHLAQRLGLGRQLGTPGDSCLCPFATLSLPGPGYHVRGVFYGWNPTHGHLLPRPMSYVPVEDVNHSDCWLHIRLYYCDVLVKEVTTRTAEGCRITSCAVPADSERLYGPSCMEQIEFPPPRALGGAGRGAGMTTVLERLLPHLERGVLLWVAPEGVFMKRQCQGRVYWNGPLAPHRDWPNKLEREKTYKLMDTQQFL
ncbi:IRF8 factor, partial [Columbina picui]|nr:IRF8 factor [Columbina picui]